MSWLLGATGRVWTRTNEVTEGGGTEAQWTPGPNLPCRIAPISAISTGARGVQISEQISERTSNILTLPAYTEIKEEDQIEVGGLGLFEVTAIHKRTFDEFVRRVEVVESAEIIPGIVSGSN